jgi:hypothetical protein
MPCWRQRGTTPQWPLCAARRAYLDDHNELGGEYLRVLKHARAVSERLLHVRCHWVAPRFPGPTASLRFCVAANPVLVRA